MDRVRRVRSERPVGVPELDDGVTLLRRTAGRHQGAAARHLAGAADQLEELARKDPAKAADRALDPAWLPAMPGFDTEPEDLQRSPEFEVEVDSPAVRASAWYELFPRSTSPDPHRPGTLRDVIRHLPYLVDLGFDTLYLPPIHPIGRSHRRGPNNSAKGGPEDPGSPWAIGSADGGHTAIAPELGTLGDFRDLVAAAQKVGIEVALDLAFQCSPDHPWVREHPDWFLHRPDGTIRTAENPPKRYDDIFPLDFETKDRRGLWEALHEVVAFWIQQGVRCFRVDNPHTKPFGFWQWLIEKVRGEHPEVIFLSEAFTRPKVMYRLAKVGFTHSYTYFAWRNTKSELTEYLRELYGPQLREFFRPHLWPNTPDILTGYLQTGGRPAFVARFVLAATLSPNYGIYGPVFELAESRALAPGTEEYLDSEKYAVRRWDLQRETPLGPVIRTVNRTRREQSVLRTMTPPVFQNIDNPSIIGYSRYDPGSGSRVLVFVNLDPHHVQAGWTDLDLGALGLRADTPFRVHDQLTDRTWTWNGPRNFVELRPLEMPAHVFVVHGSEDRS
jgi:starch synthase (maltosyl-transferring)